MASLLTEPARLAAHVLLDTVISLDEDHDAIALAFSRLNAVAPLTLRTDESGQPAAWGQDFLLGVLFTIETLLNSVVQLSGQTREEIIVLLRGLLDAEGGPPAASARSWRGWAVPVPRGSRQIRTLSTAGLSRPE